MVDLETIKTRLDKLEEALRVLEKLRQIPYEDFAADPIKYLAAQHALQIAIEACLDIGQHLIAALGLERPASYKDTFLILGKEGILTSAFAQRIVPMARFRNRLVHLYWEVDLHEIYKIIQEDLDDLREFARQILKYLAGKKSRD